MNKIIGLICILAAFLFVGCGKKGDPVAPPVLPAQATIITGTIKDSSGNPIDSAAVKVKYYFTAATKQSAKTDPCSLVSFTAYRITNGVQLNWTTEGENSAYQWEIERSVLSDTGFVLIGRVDGSGTTSTPINYSYIDSTAAADSADYYRLCLVDISGFHYYYGPVGLGPVPIYHDSFTSGYPCPFIINTQFGFSLACSSQTKLMIKQNGLTIKTLVDQTMQAGLHSLMWNGYNTGNIPVESGYYMSECVISRNDSIIKFATPLFINIDDISSIRANDYSDAQGTFNISNIPVDSTFICKDETGSIINTSKVCDSVTVYAIKSGYPERSITLTLGRNATSTINFVLE